MDSNMSEGQGKRQRRWTRSRSRPPQEDDEMTGPEKGKGRSEKGEDKGGKDRGGKGKKATPT